MRPARATTSPCALAKGAVSGLTGQPTRKAASPVATPMRTAVVVEPRGRAARSAWSAAAKASMRVAWSPRGSAAAAAKAWEGTAPAAPDTQMQQSPRTSTLLTPCAAATVSTRS